MDGGTWWAMVHGVWSQESNATGQWQIWQRQFWAPSASHTHTCPLCHPFKACLPWDVIINVIIFIGPSPGEVPGLSAPTTVEKRMLLENHYLFKQDKSFALIYSTDLILELRKLRFLERKGLVTDLSSVQLLSCVQLFATAWTAACQASLSNTNSQNLFKLMFIESVMPSNHLILCRPLLLLPSIFPSIRVFSNESGLCIRL